MYFKTLLIAASLSLSPYSYANLGESGYNIDQKIEAKREELIATGLFDSNKEVNDALKQWELNGYHLDLRLKYEEKRLNALIKSKKTQYINKEKGDITILMNEPGLTYKDRQKRLKAGKTDPALGFPPAGKDTKLIVTGYKLETYDDIYGNKQTDLFAEVSADFKNINGKQKYAEKAYLKASLLTNKPPGVSSVDLSISKKIKCPPKKSSDSNIEDLDKVINNSPLTAEIVKEHVGKCVNEKTEFLNIKYDHPDAKKIKAIDTMARTIWGEMRGCSSSGNERYPMAVAKIGLTRTVDMRARLAKGYSAGEHGKGEKHLNKDSSFEEILSSSFLADGKFHVWNKKDNNYKKILCPPVTKSPRTGDEIAWAKILDIATKAVLNPIEFSDLTKDINAVFYSSGFTKHPFGEEEYRANEVKIGGLPLIDDDWYKSYDAAVKEANSKENKAKDGPNKSVHRIMTDQGAEWPCVRIWSYKKYDTKRNMNASLKQLLEINK